MKHNSNAAEAWDTQFMGFRRLRGEGLRRPNDHIELERSAPVYGIWVWLKQKFGGES